VVELKNIKFIPEETKKARHVSRTLHRALGSIEKYEEELKEPLKFAKNNDVYWDRDRSFKRRGVYCTVWRERNTGKFAKRPDHGERAKRLNLPKDKYRKK
jgi:hypothetical protein